MVNPPNRPWPVTSVDAMAFTFPPLAERLMRQAEEQQVAEALNSAQEPALPSSPDGMSVPPVGTDSRFIAQVEEDDSFSLDWGCWDENDEPARNRTDAADIEASWFAAPSAADEDESSLRQQQLLPSKRDSAAAFDPWLAREYKTFYRRMRRANKKLKSNKPADKEENRVIQLPAAPVMAGKHSALPSPTGSAVSEQPQFDTQYEENILEEGDESDTMESWTDYEEDSQAVSEAVQPDDDDSEFSFPNGQRVGSDYDSDLCVAPKEDEDDDDWSDIGSELMYFSEPDASGESVTSSANADFIKAASCAVAFEGIVDQQQLIPSKRNSEAAFDSSVDDQQTFFHRPKFQVKKVKLNKSHSKFDKIEDDQLVRLPASPMTAAKQPESIKEDTASLPSTEAALSLSRDESAVGEQRQQSMSRKRDSGEAFGVISVGGQQNPEGSGGSTPKKLKVGQEADKLADQQQKPSNESVTTTSDSEQQVLEDTEETEEQVTERRKRKGKQKAKEIRKGQPETKANNTKADIEVQEDDFLQFFRTLPITDIKYYMKSLFQGLKTLRDKKIIHQDIEPNNFLYNIKRRTGSIIGFGMAEAELPQGKERRLKRKGAIFNDKLKTRVAQRPEEDYFQSNHQPAVEANRANTSAFKAPEVLLKSTRQTSATDVWSAGVILLCFLTSTWPFFMHSEEAGGIMALLQIFGNEEMQEVAKTHGSTIDPNTSAPSARISWRQIVEAFNGPRFKAWGNDGALALDLLEKTLALDVDQRITAADALNHPFFEEINDSTLQTLK